MQYPELTLETLTADHLNTYLHSLGNSIAALPELADEWQEMEEMEQLHFRQEFTRMQGLRCLLGAAYQGGRLTLKQREELAELDQGLLQQAASLQLMYELTLRQLLQNLFTWGTPLANYPQTLHIETTSAALAELATI